MKTIEQINPSIAHISQVVEGVTIYFQVLNEDETDWDEEATRIEYENYLSQLSL